MKSQNHYRQSKKKGEEDADLLLRNLAAAAAGQVSFALHTEPKESKSAKYGEQSDCPECGAGPATPQWGYLWRYTKPNNIKQNQ